MGLGGADPAKLMEPWQVRLRRGCRAEERAAAAGDDSVRVSGYSGTAGEHVTPDGPGATYNRGAVGGWILRGSMRVDRPQGIHQDRVVAHVGQRNRLELSVLGRAGSRPVSFYAASGLPGTGSTTTRPAAIRTSAIRPA